MQHQYISNTWINGLLTGLERLKIDLQSIESELPDFNVAHIRQGQRVDTTLVRQIWHKAEAQSQDPLLGFKVGIDLNLKGLGVLTPVLMHSPTARISLENLVNGCQLMGGHVRLSMTDEGCGETSSKGKETIAINYIPLSNPIRENSHQVVAILTSMLAMSRFMGFAVNRVIKLCLPNDLDTEALSQRLHVPVEAIDSPPYSIWFNAESFDEEIPGSDKHFYQLNKAYADELLLRIKAGNDLVASIKSLIIEHGYLQASVDVISEQLGINKRALQRQLTEEQTSFRILKEEVIKERSLLLIIQADATIEKIATDLGYSEVSAFHRAFKGWFGVTPKDYSRNQSINSPT
jgi:AraC-like DNA-binding protein